MPKTERKILDRLIQYRYWLFLLAATALAWLARKGGMDHSSPDMNVFLVPWYEQIVENGGFRALAQGVGDYNVLYQTLICLFSYIPLGVCLPCTCTKLCPFSSTFSWLWSAAMWPP